MQKPTFILNPLGTVVWEDRYGLKDEIGQLIEKDILETFSRSAKAVASKEKESQVWENGFYDIMANGLFCPAGRILAHAGTHYSQLLNCFVLQFRRDSLEEIMQTASDMAIVQKFGGGCGFQYSELRPAGSYIKGVNGRSCGVPGFANMMNGVSEVIEQGGSRRGANLGLLEVWHPDVWEFISYKSEHNWDRLLDFIDIKDEDKWASFKFNNAYKLQMYNISVGVSDEFFTALKNDDTWPFMWKDVEWELYTVAFRKKTPTGFIEKTFEVTADAEKTAIWKVKRQIPFPISEDKFVVQHRRRVKASEVWNRICHNAWTDGCPGLLNMSTLRKMHNVEYVHPILATNPCITGETLVAVADGRNAVSIKQLAEEGKDIPVYCRKENGAVTIRMMRNPRLTGYNEKIYKVTIEGGHSVRVTASHKFVISDGSEVMAKDLQAGQSLSIMTKLQAPFQKVLKNANSNSQDYYWINSTEKNAWMLDHRLIYNFFNPGFGFRKVVHHKDYNGLHNFIVNLLGMTKKEHDALPAKDRMGEANPMCRAQTEWSEEKWATYSKNMSAAVSGLANGNSSGVTNEDLLRRAVGLTQEYGRKLSTHEWEEFARGHGIPSQFSAFRNEAFGVMDFLEKAAVEAGVGGTGLRHANLREYQRYLEIKDSTDLNIFFDEIEGVIKVRKICEECGEEFIVGWQQREIGFCTQSCASRKRMSSEEQRRIVSARNDTIREKKRTALLQAYTSQRFQLGRIPMKKEFESYCRSQGIPVRFPTSYDLRTSRLIGAFKNYDDLKEQAVSYNHRVLSVAEDGFENVYNGTVDEFHNFYTGHFEEMDGNCRKFIYVNNMQCGEQPLPAFSACLLASLVLSAFVLGGQVDYKLLKKTVRTAVRFMDDVIDNCDFPLKEIKEKVNLERRIGLGTMGVHDMLIEMKLGYDTEDGRKVVAKVLECIRDEAYRTSIELAKEKGTFKVFNKEQYLQSGFIKTLPEDIQKDIAQYGIRNACLLSQAPAGTIGTLYNASTGCEPWFDLSFQRNTRLGSFEDGCPGYIKWKKGNPDKDPIKDKPSYFKTAQEISPEDHIKMLMLFSKYCDSAVSKTINLPNSATVEDVKKAFLMAMENGVKGITVFRDGCKQGVLVKKAPEPSKEPVVDDEEEETIKEDAPMVATLQPKKRGSRVVGATYRVHMQGHNLYVTVNRNPSGDLVEVFATVGESKNPTHHTSGVEDSWAEGTGKLISLALRAGVTPAAIIRNMKNIPSDKPVFTTVGDLETSELIPSPPHAIARAMEEELQYRLTPQERVDVVRKDKFCDSCSSTNLKWKSPTCYDCLDCGHSRCG